ncbi:MAG: CooT family nickel-binding protein [Oscillospiraceae bacterium]|nr:CooT family nickel-binding protein [Oscillospiraceae bacterium]
MCLSTAYRGSAEDNNLLLSNVQRIECRSGQVILTDIMERQLAVEGRIVEADLINNRVIIAAGD